MSLHKKKHLYNYAHIYIHSTKDIKHYKNWLSWFGLQKTQTASLQRGKTSLVFGKYDIKQSDGEVSVILGFWECGVPLHLS